MSTKALGKFEAQYSHESRSHDCRSLQQNRQPNHCPGNAPNPYAHREPVRHNRSQEQRQNETAQNTQTRDAMTSHKNRALTKIAIKNITGAIKPRRCARKSNDNPITQGTHSTTHQAAQAVNRQTTEGARKSRHKFIRLR